MHPRGPVLSRRDAELLSQECRIMSRMSRTRAAELARDTLRILEAGHYRTAAGEVVALGDLLRRAVEDTRSYPPDEPIPAVEPGREQTRIEVANESTLAAARRLLVEGY